MNTYYNYKYFDEPSDFNRQHLIVSDAMGYECGKNFLIDRDYFDNNLVMYVLKGTLCLTQNQKQLLLKPGEGVLMRLTQYHKYYFPKNENSHMIWFHFNGASCEALLKIADSALPLIFKSTSIEDKIYNLFEITKSNDLAKDFSISAVIYNIIINIIKMSLPNLYPHNSIHNSFTAEADRYIVKNISNQITLDDFAMEFQLSKYHFCRIFKENFKTTPFEYIKRKKVDTAKKMLIYTNDSIAEISNYLCFCDQGYFTNTFKSIVGMSPNNFRKSNIIKL